MCKKTCVEWRKLYEIIGGKKIQISIVDDEVGFSELLTEMIQKIGKETGTEFAVTHFSNGLEFTIMYNSNFDIIFMDIDMPKRKYFTVKLIFSLGIALSVSYFLTGFMGLRRQYRNDIPCFLFQLCVFGFVY